MKSLIALAALAMFSMGGSGAALAGTVPSTFDENCNVNWKGGGCGERMAGSGASSAVVRVRAPGSPDEPSAPPNWPDKPKGNNGHGNGDEGDCSGSGCSDPTNPGKGPKNK